MNNFCAFLFVLIPKLYCTKYHSCCITTAVAQDEKLPWQATFFYTHLFKEGQMKWISKYLYKECTNNHQKLYKKKNKLKISN